jgi:hypothetical protein
MSPAKVTLSPKERELVLNRDWILTKNDIIGKVYTLFGNLSEIYRETLFRYPHLLTDDPGFRSPKIARGEQYKGLPWVMLDHPRYFSGKDHFAIRTLFWWGNEGSITLQLGGSFQQQYAASIQRYFSRKPDAGKKEGTWWLGTGTDPWAHHFEETNYRLLAAEQGYAFAEMPFIKLAKKIALEQWDDWPAFFSGVFEEILEILGTENNGGIRLRPDGETVP